MSENAKSVSVKSKGLKVAEDAVAKEDLCIDIDQLYKDEDRNVVYTNFLTAYPTQKG